MLFGVAVPTLPHGRRAIAHGVEPGRIVLLQENLVSEVGATEAGEHGQQQRRADEAGRQTTSPDLDQIDEMREGFRSELRRQQIEGQSQQISRLAMADHASVRRDIGIAKSFDDPPVELAEFQRITLLSEHPGDLRHEVRGVREVSRPDQIARHGRVLRGHRVDGQPVAVGRARTDQVLGSALLISDPALHRVVVLRQDFLVAVVSVNFPRTDHTGIGPCRITELMRAVFSENIGRHVRIRTVGPLAIAQVLCPLAEKVPHIIVEGRGADKHLRVAGPTETLVALRTIGRDI